MKTLTENIPDELKALDRWVLVEPDSKLPFSPTGFCASSSSSATWGSYQEAMSTASVNSNYSYLGFVFAQDGYVGIDIDCGFDEWGCPTDDALELIRAAGSYTEISKSGRGFHVLVKGDIPFKGRNNNHGWEIYKTSRYFVMTGAVLDGYTEIKPAQRAIDAVLSRHFEDVLVSSQSDKKERIWEPIYAKPKKGRISLEPEYPPVAEGGRHLAMVSFAGSLWQRGLDKKDVLTESLKINDLKFHPPLEEKEVERVVMSITRYKRGDVCGSRDYAYHA